MASKMEEVASILKLSQNKSLNFQTVVLSDFLIKFSVYVNHNFVEQSILMKSTSISTVFLQ